jgi:hypothetical protein
MRFGNPRNKLQGTVGGTWGVMEMKFKGTGCAPCGALCGLRIGQTNAIFTKKSIDYGPTGKTNITTKSNGSPRKGRGGQPVEGRKF